MTSPKPIKPNLTLTRSQRIELEWYSGTGPGGQHRNKSQNCCRVRWRAPDGTVLRASGTEARDRPTNKRTALERLKRLVVAHLAALKDDGRERRLEERVRTYHEARNVVTDHASGVELPYKQVMEKRDLGPLIMARAQAKKVSGG